MPRTVDINKLAERLEPNIRRAFLKSIQDAANRVNLKRLTELIEAGDVAGALRLVGIDPATFSTLALEHTNVYNRGGIAVAQSIPPAPQAAGYSVQILFDVRNPVAEAWIRNKSSTLIQEIVEDQRTVIRTHLERGLAQGANPRTTALDLVGRIDLQTRQRTGGVIGLHSEQEKWMYGDGTPSRPGYVGYLNAEDTDDYKRLLDYGLRDKRFDRTILKSIKNETALPAEIRAKMRVAYSNNALKWRADNIARTETIRALGEAQTEAFRQAIDGGKLEADTITRFWDTAGDERVRESHRQIPGMNPKGVAWNEPFQTPDGPAMHAPFGYQCRCVERVEVDFFR